MEYTMRYPNHHTGYGPILGGAQGFSDFKLRPQTDSGAVKIDKLGYRENLKPSKKRHCLVNLVVKSAFRRNVPIANVNAAARKAWSTIARSSIR